MKPTMEVRWFLKGSLPDEIRHWFQQDALAPINDEEREDWYFSLPQQHTLSIKLRQGNLELKQRTDDRGVQKLAKGVKGRVEQWMKWSFSLDDEKQNYPDLAVPQPSWIVVKKNRQLKQYEVTEDDRVKGLAPGSKMEQGCTLEMTELQICDHAWYSFGFEASGQEDKLEQVLERVTQQVLTDSAFLSLKAKHSFSYPKWLAIVLND